MKKPSLILPLILAAIFACGIYLGKKLDRKTVQSEYAAQQFRFNKFNDILNYVSEEYVDTVNKTVLMESAVNSLLQNLDPHSVYITADELKEMNEPLEGNFEGIGIEFNIIGDTIVVISPIAGGPSELLGIRAGDRIVKIEGKNVCGVGITTKDVIQKLRGDRGTKVNVAIARQGVAGLLNFTITRDKIPINSVEVSYMLNDSTGYIKVSRFAVNTDKEFRDALEKLESSGMKQLIIDLRNNPGGYLNAATKIANELLEPGKLIVYTEGHARPKNAFYSSSGGAFQKGKLVVLIDEGSASASEILAGAIQDNDRGIIIGRRSFGKGLVQEQSSFPDGSAIRLTVARYYTPSGRCIQRPYAEGAWNYYEEHYKQLTGEERFHPDSASLPDSLKYKTKGGRTVFGGGGIMPDVFVAADTSGYSYYLGALFNKGILNRFAFRYADTHRKELEKYANPGKYLASFTVDNTLMEDLFDFAGKEGIQRNGEEISKSSSVIRIQIKALIARNIWNNEGYYPVLHQMDKTLGRAAELLRQRSEYTGFLQVN